MEELAVRKGNNLKAESVLLIMMDCESAKTIGSLPMFEFEFGLIGHTMKS